MLSNWINLFYLWQSILSNHLNLMNRLGARAKLAGNLRHRLQLQKVDPRKLRGTPITILEQKYPSIWTIKKILPQVLRLDSSPIMWHISAATMIRNHSTKNSWQGFWTNIHRIWEETTKSRPMTSREILKSHRICQRLPQLGLTERYLLACLLENRSCP